jgi:hypothetical protein
MDLIGRSSSLQQTDDDAALTEVRGFATDESGEKR